MRRLGRGETLLKVGDVAVLRGDRLREVPYQAAEQAYLPRDLRNRRVKSRVRAGPGLLMQEAEFDLKETGRHRIEVDGDPVRGGPCRSGLVPRHGAACERKRLQDEHGGPTVVRGSDRPRARQDGERERSRQNAPDAARAQAAVRCGLNHRMPAPLRPWHSDAGSPYAGRIADTSFLADRAFDRKRL